MNRILYLLLAAAMVMALSACGADVDTGQETGDSVQTENTQWEDTQTGTTQVVSPVREVTADHVIINHGANSAYSSFTDFSRLHGDHFESVRFVGFDAQWNEAEPWFKSTEWALPEDGTPISEEEALAIIASYPAVELELTPLQS